jgi:hypothetical protein
MSISWLAIEPGYLVRNLRLASLKVIVPSVTESDVRRVSRLRRLAATGHARTLRRRGHLSLAEMASAIGDGVPLSALSRWERGLTTPSTRNALAWAQALERVLDIDIDTEAVDVA